MMFLGLIWIHGLTIFNVVNPIKIFLIPSFLFGSCYRVVVTLYFLAFPEDAYH